MGGCVLACSKSPPTVSEFVVNNGFSLAMAEMTVLCAALYREYNTTIAPGFEDTSPAITARVETFYDERFPKVKVRPIPVR